MGYGKGKKKLKQNKLPILKNMLKIWIGPAEIKINDNQSTNDLKYSDAYTEQNVWIL